MDARVFLPGPADRTVKSPAGVVVKVPRDWDLLPPGDAALTRRVKAAGEHWVVQEKKGRKIFSRGVWAPRSTIQRIQFDLEQERSTEQFAKRKEASVKRREKIQNEYEGSFLEAVYLFLNFHPAFDDMAKSLAEKVTVHATPVGSGTVARTSRIPIEKRAEAAVIAWLRHQTTAYDSLKIPREKGKRREVRRMLAQRSVQLLAQYRRGEPPAENCPLQAALSK